GKSYYNLYKRFTGFPDFVLEDNDVTLILPSLQPWEFNMLPLPHVISSTPMFQFVATLLDGLASSSAEISSQQYISKMMDEHPLAAACLYLVGLISVETINVDAVKHNFRANKIVLRSEIAPDMRQHDIKFDRISIPTTAAELDSTLQSILQMLENRKKSARYNIDLRERLPTRIAYETNQPSVRQPNERDDGKTTEDSKDIEKTIQGLDVFQFGGGVALARKNLISQMAASVDKTSTSITEL